MNRSKTPSLFVEAFTQISKSPQHPEMFKEIESDPTILTELNSKFAENLRKKEISATEILLNFHDICVENITNLSEIIGEQKHYLLQEKIEYLNPDAKLLSKEKDTWMLLKMLIEDMSKDKKVHEIDLEKDEQWRYSHKQLVENFKLKNSQFNIQMLVINWLEIIFDESRDKMSEFAFEGEFKNTQNNLQDFGISGVDPDVKNREGKFLDDDDENENEKIVSKIWEYVRSGDIEGAKEFCRKSKQFWRAATLSACSLYHNYMLHPVSENGDFSGNEFRARAIEALFVLSNETKFDERERSVYGALCGNLSAMNLSCETWYDSLWALMKASCETIINETVFQTDEKMIYQPIQKDIKKIVESLKNSSNKNIRQESYEPFHIIQSYIIEWKPYELVSLIATWTTDERISEFAHLFRFATHFTLFLIDSSPDEDEILNEKKFQEEKDLIVIRHIDHLIKIKQYDLISTYTQYLTEENQIKTYARFLQRIEDDKERQHFYNEARNIKLPINEITKKVVETIKQEPVSKDSKNLTNGGVRKINSMKSQQLTNEDKRKINSIRFLIFDKNQYFEALTQSNAIMRYFILNSKPLAAAEIPKQLPDDFESVLTKVHSEEQNYVNYKLEYQSLEIYLDALSKYKLFFQNQCEKPTKPEEPQKFQKPSDKIEFDHKMKKYINETEEWKTLDKELYKNSKDALYDVLQFPHIWLTDFEDEFSKDSQREDEMDKLKKKCIPSTVFLLLALMSQRGDLNACRGLAELVADEYYQLYLYFDNDELKEFLKSIKDCY
eukprot:gene11084-3790_t